MKLRKTVAAALAAVSLAVGSLTFTASPASAHHDGWHTTVCYGGAPIYGKYYTVANDRTNVYTAPWGNWHVTGRILGHYLFAGAIGCSFWGFPTSNDAWTAEGDRYQFFYQPGTCDLRWIMEWKNGSVTGHSMPNVYC